MKIDAKIDFLYGSIFGAMALLFGAGGLVLLTIPLCAILYAMGGDDEFASGWRDLGCSFVMSTCLFLATANWLFFPAAAAVFGLFTIGLGLPSTQPPDEGSPVGRVAWKLAGGREWLANLYTHVFLYASACAVYFTASILRGAFNA